MPADMISALDVLLVGPSSTIAERAALLTLAAALELDGHRVVSPFDVNAATLASASHARAVAEALLEADVAVFADGWETCPHAASTFAQAEALSLAVVA